MPEKYSPEVFSSVNKKTASKKVAGLACAALFLLSGCDGNKEDSPKHIATADASEGLNSQDDSCPKVSKETLDKIDKALQTDFEEFSEEIAKKQGIDIEDWGRVTKVGREALGITLGYEQNTIRIDIGDDDTDVLAMVNETNKFTKEAFDFTVRLANKEDKELFSSYSIDILKEEEFASENIKKLNRGGLARFNSLNHLPVDLIKKTNIKEVVILDEASIIEKGKEVGFNGMVVEDNVIGITDEALDNSTLLHEIGHIIDNRSCEGKNHNDPEFANLQPDWLNNDVRQAIYGNPNREEKCQAIKEFMVDPYGLKNDREDKANTLEHILDGNDKIIKRNNAYKEKAKLLLARIEELSPGTGQYLAMFPLTPRTQMGICDEPSRSQ